MSPWYFVAVGVLLLALLIIQHVIQSGRKKAEKVAEQGVVDNDSRMFRCLIPDRPLTEWERLEVGVASMGTFRATLRDALAKGNPESLEIEAKDNHGTPVKVASIPWKDVTHFEFTSLSIKSQLANSLVVSMVVGMGIGLMIFLMVCVQIGFSRLADDLGRTLMVGAGILGAGLVLGILFSFVPNLFRLRGDLIQLVLTRTNAATVVLVVESGQHQKAIAVIEEFGVKKTGGIG